MSEKDDILERLSAYLDGELSPEEAGAVERAMRANARIADEYRRIQAVRALVRGLPRERAGEDFVARVLGRAERTHLVAEPVEVRERGVLRWARHMATAAMVLIAVGIGGVIAVTLWKTPDIGPAAPVGGLDSGRYAKHLDAYYDREQPARTGGGELAMAKGSGNGVHGTALPGSPLNQDLAGGATSTQGGEIGALCCNFVIEAPDLDQARRSVEDVLGRVKLRAPGEKKDMEERAASHVDRDGWITRADDQDVQYRMRMTADEASQLRKDIEQLRSEIASGELFDKKKEAVVPGGPARDGSGVTDDLAGRKREDVSKAGKDNAKEGIEIAKTCEEAMLMKDMSGAGVPTTTPATARAAAAVAGTSPGDMYKCADVAMDKPQLQPAESTPEKTQIARSPSPAVVSSAPARAIPPVAVVPAVPTPAVPATRPAAPVASEIVAGAKFAADKGDKRDEQKKPLVEPTEDTHRAAGPGAQDVKARGVRAGKYSREGKSLSISGGNVAKDAEKGYTYAGGMAAGEIEVTITLRKVSRYGDADAAGMSKAASSPASADIHIVK